MSLNSEPVPEENDLLRLIDAGISGLGNREETILSVDAEQILKSEQKKKK